MNNSPQGKPRKTWKDHLLRSGIPLEYEVAKVLADEGMSVDADFSFQRRDIAGMKECSVDISASWLGPDEHNPNLSLNIILESKYRSQEKTLLFLEDPNELYPPATLGGTVNSFDQFVPFNLPLNAFVSLEDAITLFIRG